MQDILLSQAGAHVPSEAAHSPTVLKGVHWCGCLLPRQLGLLHLTFFSSKTFHFLFETHQRDRGHTSDWSRTVETTAGKSLPGVT